MELRALRYFVAVADERHIGRAASRLHMTQPPLSRAIKQLETELGAVMLNRTSSGVTLTAAGTVLYDEARTLLAQSEELRTRVNATAASGSITVGVLADSADEAGAGLAADFRQRHPQVDVRIREADFTDPTAGLRAGLVDVALTRAPFDAIGIDVHVLRSDPVGVVLRSSDALAQHHTLQLCDLDSRQWFQLPEGTDPIWRGYWNGTSSNGALRRKGPVVRTVHECMQAVFWTDTIGLAPLGHALPDGLTTVPLADMAPSRLVVAWNSANPSPLIRSFVEIAAATYRPAAGTPIG